MDFTLKKYKELLLTLQKAEFEFLTFEQYCIEKQLAEKKQVILRHDVDLLPKNSLQFAQIEHDLGIKSTYYFRIVSSSNNPKIIKQIAALGHEIGYHYEDLTICKGNRQKALCCFKTNLNYFRQFYPIKTICMHGSPRTKWDNKAIWEDFDYKQFRIIGEPYFDTDFNTIFYLTDTGRCWDGDKFSIRDKVKSPFLEKFHTTSELISAIKNNAIPSKILITTHPQRWSNNLIEWCIEYCSQNLKNLIKRLLIKQ